MWQVKSNKERILWNSFQFYILVFKIKTALNTQMNTHIPYKNTSETRSRVFLNVHTTFTTNKRSNESREAVKIAGKGWKERNQWQMRREDLVSGWNEGVNDPIRLRVIKPILFFVRQQWRLKRKRKYLLHFKWHLTVSVRVLLQRASVTKSSFSKQRQRLLAILFVNCSIMVICDELNFLCTELFHKLTSKQKRYYGWRMPFNCKLYNKQEKHNFLNLYPCILNQNPQEVERSSCSIFCLRKPQFILLPKILAKSIIENFISKILKQISFKHNTTSIFSNSLKIMFRNNPDAT